MMQKTLFTGLFLFASTFSSLSHADTTELAKQANLLANKVLRFSSQYRYLSMGARDVEVTEEDLFKSFSDCVKEAQVVLSGLKKAELIAADVVFNPFEQNSFRWIEFSEIVYDAHDIVKKTSTGSPLESALFSLAYFSEDNTALTAFQKVAEDLPDSIYNELLALHPVRDQAGDARMAQNKEPAVPALPIASATPVAPKVSSERIPPPVFPSETSPEPKPAPEVAQTPKVIPPPVFPKVPLTSPTVEDQTSPVADQKPAPQVAVTTAPQNETPKPVTEAKPTPVVETPNTAKEKTPETNLVTRATPVEDEKISIGPGSQPPMVEQLPISELPAPEAPVIVAAPQAETPKPQPSAVADAPSAEPVAVETPPTAVPAPAPKKKKRYKSNPLDFLRNMSLN